MNIDKSLSDIFRSDISIEILKKIKPAKVL